MFAISHDTFWLIIRICHCIRRKYCINCYFYTLIVLPMWELGCGKLKGKGEVKRKKGKPKPLKAALFTLKS